MKTKHLVLIVVMAALLISCGEPMVSTGERGRLDSGGKMVMMAFDQETHKEWIKICASGDQMGMAELVIRKKILPIECGTDVLVIDQDMGIRKVRILSGANTGTAGWVSMEFVKK